MTELPDEIDRIEVWTAQDVDFCYYAYYFCYVNKDYWKINRDTYIHSDDPVSYSDSGGFGERPQGPKFDPTLQKYENDASRFLSNYTNGLFLNEEYSCDKAVPSLRILSTPSIEFSNISGWTEKYWLFLEYMRMSRYCNTYQASIMSLQTERIFEKSNVSKGITILYSEKDVPTDMTFIDKYGRILSNASVLNVAILDYFLPLYWANYNIFSPLESWKTRLKDKMSKIKSNPLTSEELEDNVTEIINIYGQFAAFSNDEKINIRTARKNFNISFSNLLLQKSNMLIQKRLGLFTIVVAIVGVAVTVVSIFF